MVNISSSDKRSSLSLDFRLITILLLAIIVGMLIVWKPWGAAFNDVRTVEVMGETTLRAEPDEFVFMPAYEFKNADKQAALSELTQKSKEVIEGLKNLGVAENKILTNSSGNSFFPHYYDEGTKTNNYTLQITAILENLELAQKVQDYLVTTLPTGSISPQFKFSDVRKKELENKARDEAIKDARAKAEQSARNLGFKIGKVRSVVDGAGFNGDFPSMDYQYETKAMGIGAEDSSLAVKPGESKINYSVKVTYYLR